ncbi:hypothetical protein CY658_21775 [Variovorax sp. RO1]|nr:hypothetical protein CY658_21775 [Variovorax sp. RO1]
MYGRQSIDELRQAVETNKRNFCSYLVIKEYYAQGAARSTSCIVPPQEATQRDQNAATMARRRFEDSCAAQLTTADIMERNQQILGRASAIEAKASAAATRKQQQAEWSTEAKNFELKGLTLALTKESLMAMTPGRSFFSCKPSPSFQLVETCFAVLDSKTCIPQVVDTPKGPMQRMECKTVQAAPSSLPAGVQALTTFAGRNVVEVQVSFFQNKTLNVTLFANLENAPAEDALSSKYGAPRERRDGMTFWYGKGEQLALSRDRVQIHSPVVGAQRDAAAKALEDAKVQADGVKAKADKEKRRGDF